MIVYATFVKTVYGGVIIFCYGLGSHSSPLPIACIFDGEWYTLVFMDFDHGVCPVLKSILCVLNIFRVFAGSCTLWSISEIMEPLRASREVMLKNRNRTR